MNPLSPFTYYLRHKRRASLLLVLITLATIGLYVMVSVLDSIPMRGHVNYLTKVSRVYPAVGNSFEPGVVAQIQVHPDVERIIWDNGLPMSPPTLIGTDSFRLMGVTQEDARFLMAHFGVRLKEGRMFEARTNEIVLSEEVVRALGLQIGDEIDRSINETYYGAIPVPLRLVGILEGDPMINQGPSTRVGFASYEYLESHESFNKVGPNILVVAKEDRKAAVDEFLETNVASELTETETFREVSMYVKMGRMAMYVISTIVNCLVAIIVALVVGVINRLAVMERLPELGLLNAMGYHRKQLVSRLTLETAIVAVSAWGIGLGLALLAMAGLKASLYYSRGMELDLANLAPVWFTLPVPVVVVAFAASSARQVFARLDAIAIIEKGKLSMEAEQSQRSAKRSFARPLSSWTFYRRHRRRGALLVASMALMILGISFPGFLISLPMEKMESGFAYLRYVSEVAPVDRGAVDAGVVAQIRSHPAVAGLIQVMPLGLRVHVPPGGEVGCSIYGVSQDELPVMMDVFEEHLLEGRLPRPRSNEIVISKAIAQNRGLNIGDKVGRPVQRETDSFIADDIPIEMVVVGLLSQDDIWLGLASLEYLQSHELTASRQTAFFIIPIDGRKGEIDAWLETNIPLSHTSVLTYEVQRRKFRQVMQMLLLLFAGVESIIAIVAAIALAVLNYIFFAQRQEEFGTLYALGRSRPWLILRTARETGSAVGLAWLFGAAICLAGLVIAQATLYAPIGLNLDLLNPAPWLFTLPIPLAVVAVSAGTITWILSRLDPVSVIERR